MYAATDETMQDWAERRTEREVQDGVLASLRAAIPQTAPANVVANAVSLPAVLRQIEDALELREAGDSAEEGVVAAVDGLPEELRAAMMGLLGIGEGGHSEPDGDESTEEDPDGGE